MPIARIGQDFIVNSTTLDGQYNPAITALAGGRYLVTWESYDASGSDADDSCIRARLYEADGSPAGSDFVVNTTAASGQYKAAATALSDGRFLVTWESYDGSGSDTSGACIRARLYEADGSPAGNDFVVNATTAAGQYGPSATALPDGRFAVTWTSSDRSGSDTASNGIRARLFDADGQPAGHDFVVNTTTVNNQFGAAITALPDGRLVVTWTSDDASGGDTSGFGIRARLYEADGSAAGDDFVVNSTTAESQDEAAVTALPDGRFVVTWGSDDGRGSDTSDNCIRARIYNADGSAAGADFVVNSTTFNEQYSPAVTALADGRFVIAWQSFDEASAGGSDSSGYSIRARLFNIDGSPSGDDFVVNSTTISSQMLPAVTALADGRFVTAWESYDGTGSDRSASSIRAQVLDPTAFDGTDGADAWQGGNLADRISGHDAADTLSGLGGNDTIKGGGGADTLAGGAGDDLINGGSGDDLIDGGAGEDIAEFLGDYASYAIEERPDRVIVTGPDGTDTLTGIEQLRFFDLTVRLAALPLAAMPENSARIITQAELLAGVDGAATAHGLAIASGSGTLVENPDGSWTYRPAADDDTAVSFSYLIGTGHSIMARATLDITPVNHAPAVSGPVALAPVEAGGARLITQAELLANASDADGPSLAATGLQIASGHGTLVDNHDGSWTYTPAPRDGTPVTFSYAVTDGTTPVAARATLVVQRAPEDAPPVQRGTEGDDTFDAPAGAAHFDGLAGIDTMRFGFRLTDAEVSHVGNTVVMDGPSGQTILAGFERFVFTDGTVDNADADRMVDDLFYYSQYHDVWNAGVSADEHFAAFGRDEGRNPNPLFDTAGYLAAYADVRDAGVNAFEHYGTFGWREGRDPSAAFDGSAYLAAYQDVAAAGVDPLAHYLQFGIDEGRSPFADGMWG